MTAADTARAIEGPIGDLGGRFMLSGRTYARGADLGFAGLDFYFCGRGGVLGEVDADVVTTEFGVFEPNTVRTNWEAGLAVMPVSEAAARYVEIGHEWGRARLPDDLDSARLSELLRRVVDAAGEDRPELYRAWSAVPWPDDDRGAALHGIHLLRELRGGVHMQAMRAADLDPHLAITIKAGVGMATFMGWPEPHPDPETGRALWDAVEETTNASIAPAVECLDDAEQAELISLVSQAAAT